jgi:outer membrane protein assembly factor BamE (lipoprotein component of BamABCDE complex)
MSRRDSYDGPQEDYDDDPSRKKSNTGLIVGLVVGGLVLMLLVVAGVFALLVIPSGNRRPANPPAAQSKAADTEVAKRVYDRPEFEKLVKGKNKSQILNLLGKPEKTDVGESGTWYYDRITREPVTGKVDESTRIWFNQEGFVTEARY